MKSLYMLPDEQLSSVVGGARAKLAEASKSIRGHEKGSVSGIRAKAAAGGPVAVQPAQKAPAAAAAPALAVNQAAF